MLLSQLTTKNIHIFKTDVKSLEVSSPVHMREPGGVGASGCWCGCFRSSRSVHRCIGVADCLRQWSRGPAGTGPGSLLHVQRSVSPRAAADQQLQVQRRRHSADIRVAARSLAIRKQPGKNASTVFLQCLASAVVFTCLCCRKWTQSPVEAAPSPTLLRVWNRGTTLQH